MEVYQRFRDFAEIWDFHHFFKKIIDANIAVGSSSEQAELEFDFDEFMSNKSLSWHKKCEEYFNLRRFHKKH